MILGHRKLHGDLIYLYAVTMEEKRLHITACTRGFYINQSTDEEFNPKPANPNHLSHSLIELLSQVSPSFKRNFIQLQRKRTQRHPFERVATPYQVFKILTNSCSIAYQSALQPRCTRGLHQWPIIRSMPSVRKMPFRRSLATKSTSLVKLGTGTRSFKRLVNYRGKICPNAFLGKGLSSKYFRRC